MYLKRKLFILIIFSLVVFSGCNSKSSNETNTEKLVAEIKYISSEIFDISNMINNISFENYELIPKEVEITTGENNSESSSGQDSSSGGESNSPESSGGQGTENQSNKVTSTEMKETNSLNENTTEIDWQTIKSKIEAINSIWSVISVDLSKEKVADNDLQDFNNLLNKTIISIKNEDKNLSLENISNLYSYIPTFINYISFPNKDKVILETKAEILQAYTLVLKDDWDNVSKYIINAKNSFMNILNNKEEIEGKEYKFDKIRMIIQKLEESIELEDSQLFLLQYKLLIEQLNQFGDKADFLRELALYIKDRNK